MGVNKSTLIFFRSSKYLIKPEKMESMDVDNYIFEINKLPDEVIAEILGHLTPEEIKTSSLVCKR